MTMAYWNGMTWGVSSKEIAFLESLTTMFSIETDTNADKEGMSPTEEVAYSLVEFTLNTTYRVETGTKDVRGMINKWKSLVGKAAPLVIGGSTFGPDNMQLQSVGVSNLQISAAGVMRAVTLSFKFKEFVNSENGVTTEDSGTTAVNVTASSTDKEAKKTVQISGSDSTSLVNKSAVTTAHAVY